MLQRGLGNVCGHLAVAVLATELVGAREKSLLFLDGDCVTLETPWTPILLSSSSLANSSAPVSREILYSHSCLNIFLYNALLFITVNLCFKVLTRFTKFDQHKHKFWGYGYNDLCYNTHNMIIFFSERAQSTYIKKYCQFNCHQVPVTLVLQPGSSFR